MRSQINGKLMLLGKRKFFVAIAVLSLLAVMLCGCANDGVKKSVDEYTWDELSAISEEIAAAADEDAAIEIAKKYNLTTDDGKLDGTQVKSIELSNGETAEVQIVGFRHDDKTSGGKVGITFIFKDAIIERPMNSTDSNAGGWQSSQMRTWLASEGIEMLPVDLSDKIAEVDKASNNVGMATSISAVTLTSDKLWLFSATELCGPIDWWMSSNQYCNDIQSAEGTEYKLFRDQAVDSISGNEILKKTLNGDPCRWGERSASPYVPNRFGLVSADGDPGSGIGPLNSRAVVPGFCI